MAGMGMGMGGMGGMNAPAPSMNIGGMGSSGGGMSGGGMSGGGMSGGAMGSSGGGSGRGNSGGSSSNRSAAKSMASSGSSAKQIAKQTGVSRQAARNIVQRTNNNQQMAIRNAVDQRAQSGGNVGQQWFEGSGLNAGQRQAAMDYASSQGYNLGGAWADEKNPIFNSAGDQVRRVGTERTAEQLAQRDALKQKYGDNFQEKFVAGLMSPGQKGYDASTGGGNWVYSQGQIDEEALRAWYRGDPNNGTDLALQGKNRGDFTLDGLYGQYSAPGTGQAAQENVASQRKAVGRKAAMADGKVGRRDIRAYMKEKGIKGSDRQNAQMRIADRWSSKKGVRLGQGVVKDYARNFEKKNPFMAMMIQSGANPYGVMDAKVKGKSRNDLYRASRDVLDSKNYAKGDVFARLKDGTLRGETRVGGTGVQTAAASNAAPTAPTSTASPVSTETYTPMIPEEVQADPLGPGSLLGGGDGALGASKLGRARSRLRRLGINNQGSSLLNRSLQYGNVLNR
jgi:hypothetical protein